MWNFIQVNFLATARDSEEEVVRVLFQGNVIKRKTAECEMHSLSFFLEADEGSAEDCPPFSYDILSSVPS